MGTVRKVFKDLYGRFVKRKAQEFNIENRAHKFLDQTKLPNAPGHLNEGKILEKILKENPQIKEEVDKKHEKLVDNMGQVEIKVTYPPERKTSKKNLPKDRTIIPKDTNFKVHNVPAGCIDFEIFLKIFDYKYNHLWTNEEIAEEFDLDEKNVDDLLFFFKPFNNKIVDKKRYIANSYPAADKTYVKVAELLNRDVETFKEIPEYKKELARIEEENKQNQIEEITKEDEIYEETEDEYLERVNSQEFIKEKFFIADQTDQTDQTNETDKTDRTEKKENNNGKVKNDKKESSKDDIKEESKKDEVKNEENKKSEVKKESNDKDAKKKTAANLKEETKKKTKNGKDKKEAKDDKKVKATKTKKNGKNSQSNGLKKDVKDNSK